MYELSVQPFRTPRGRPVSMWLRDQTNDHNTLQSCMTQDEYGLADLYLDGWALDIGAHLGGVTIALAVDNPHLKVVAVEPVPGNVELLRRNIELNHVGPQVTVIEGAAGDGAEVEVRHGYSGSELATHHAFIGNAILIEPGSDHPHKVRRMRSRTLSEISFAAGLNVNFVKVDAEGAEWDLDFSKFPLVRGEWHPVNGHTQEEFADRLSVTHEVTFSGPVEGPGGFVAVRS